MQSNLPKTKYLLSVAKLKVLHFVNVLASRPSDRSTLLKLFPDLSQLELKIFDNQQINIKQSTVNV